MDVTDVPAAKKPKCSNTTNINNLPDVILARVFHFVPVVDLALNVTSVCKKWKAVSKDVDVWMGKSYSPTLWKGKNTGFEIRKAVAVLRNAPLLENFCVDLNYPEETILLAAAACGKLKKVGLVVVRSTGHAILKFLTERHSSIQHLLLYFHYVRKIEIVLYIREIFLKITECENLKTLVLHGSRLSALPIDALQSLDNLQKLVFHNLDASVSYRVIMMLESNSFPCLESLDFEHNLCLCDTVMDAIFETCKNLKSLRIVNCTPVTENGFASMYQLQKLEVFLLDKCPSVWGGGLIKHIAKCKSLVSVHILHILGIRMQDMIHWENMPFLRDVDIDDTCHTGDTNCCNCNRTQLFEQL